MNCLIPNFHVTWQHVPYQTGRPIIVRTGSPIHSLVFYPKVFCQHCGFFLYLCHFRYWLSRVKVRVRAGVSVRTIVMATSVSETLRRLLFGSHIPWTPPYLL